MESMKEYTNWCVKCHALEHEPARPTCSNPTWHEPPAARLELVAEAPRDDEEPF